MINCLMLISALAIGWLVGMVTGRTRMHKFLNEQNSLTERLIRDENTALCGQLFGNYPPNCSSQEADRNLKLMNYEPSKSTDEIVLCYNGLKPDLDFRIRIQGNGILSVLDHGTVKSLTTIDAETCKTIFHRVLTCGILNWNSDVLDLKFLLLPNKKLNIVTREFGMEATFTSLEILIPEMELSKVIVLHDPITTAKELPELIEFRLYSEIEQQMRRLLPNEVHPPN